MNEIVDAVALQGFAELAHAVRVATQPQLQRRDGTPVQALADAYVDFATRNPAVYDAMFTMTTGLAFADAKTPNHCARGSRT